MDLTSTRYSMVMLLSGGIGVTPMQSIAHQLMYEHEWGERVLKKLWFVWTARDPMVMSNMDVISSHSSHPSTTFSIENATIVDSIGSSDHANFLFKTESNRSVLSAAGANLIAFPSSKTTDEELAVQIPFDDDFEDYDDEDGQTSDLESGERSKMPQMSETDTTDGHYAEVDIPTDEGILELDCYLTATEMHECGLGELPFVRQSRPDMKHIFLAMRKEAIRQGEKRVAICVCAPTRLVDITRKACVKFSNRHVRFDFHYEVFD